MQEFAEDAAQILAERGRGLSRRQLLGAAAAMGIAPSLAHAAVPDVVLCNWGGDAIKAMTEAFVVPYEKATGGKMVIDGSGPANGKMRAMVEAKHVIWDMCDSGVAGIGELGPLGLLEPIDYSIVDRSHILPEFGYKYGVVNYMFSSVLAWDTKQVKTTPTPADFFDLKTFPGKRMIRKDSQGMLELALIADGVPIDKLYPLDQERALKKIASIKDELLYWSTGAQSQDLLRSGEVVMGWLWHTRANLLKQDTKGRIDWTFNGGLIQPGLWAVPKGNPAGKQVMVAIATLQAVPGQIALLGAMGNGPANPQASGSVPADLVSVDPGAPANLAVQARISAPWYEAHYGASLKAFLDMVAS
jgi:putative spermidine/putrescine transport system substrate-binding protein